MPETKNHTVSVLVENEFGVLTRVAGLFSGRGFNIESLAVAPTLDPTTSRITIVTSGDARIIEQIIKQLRKLVPVIRVTDLMELEHVDREMALIKVAAPSDKRSQVLDIVNIFRAKIVDVSHDSMVVEATGDEGKVTAIIGMLSAVGIREIARSGKVSLARGNRES